MLKLLIILVLITLCHGVDNDATQLIESRGFQSKTYTVETSDGYILTLFRVINPHWTGRTRKSVLLQHGLTWNAYNWFQNTPGKLHDNGSYVEETGVVTDCSALNASAVGNTIPFVLSVCGYDVWLGNNRGTKYSTGHVMYDMSKDYQYWDYSVDDLMKDDTAMINFIRNETNSDTIGYIGHSLGTAQMFQLLTESEHINKVLKPYIALGPVAHLGNVNLADKAAATLEPLFANLKGPFFVLPSNKLKYADHLLSDVCNTSLTSKLCESVMFLIGGFNYQDNKSKYYPDRVGHAPDDTSFKIAAHMSQRVLTNSFAKYDYHLANLQHYGQLLPPKYDLAKITNQHIYLVSGPNDLLADPKDVQQLRENLEVPFQDYVIPHYEHFDLIWADNLGEMLNSKMLAWLDKLD